jgi:hypothetical protein
MSGKSLIDYSIADAHHWQQRVDERHRAWRHKNVYPTKPFVQAILPDKSECQ